MNRSTYKNYLTTHDTIRIFQLKYTSSTPATHGKQILTPRRKVSD